MSKNEMYKFSIYNDQDQRLTYLDLDIINNHIAIGSLENIGIKGDAVKIMKYAMMYLKKYRFVNENPTVGLWVIPDHIPSHLYKPLVKSYIIKYETRPSNNLNTYYMKTYGFKQKTFRNDLITTLDDIIYKLQNYNIGTTVIKIETKNNKHTIDTNSLITQPRTKKSFNIIERLSNTFRNLIISKTKVVPTNNKNIM